MNRPRTVLAQRKFVFSILGVNHAAAKVLICLLVVTAAHASAPVYRCEESDKVIYSDRPCRAAATSKVIQHDYSTPYGEWRGQSQFQASVAGKQVPEAHTVLPLVVSIDHQGKVKGVSEDNGCRLLGLANPFTTPTVLQLDLTLSGCSIASYNRRYKGNFALHKATNHARLTLQSYWMQRGKPTAFFEIEATLRR